MTRTDKKFINKVYETNASIDKILLDYVFYMVDERDGVMSPEVEELKERIRENLHKAQELVNNTYEELKRFEEA